MNQSVSSPQGIILQEKPEGSVDAGAYENFALSEFVTHGGGIGIYQL